MAIAPFGPVSVNEWGIAVASETAVLVAGWLGGPCAHLNTYAASAALSTIAPSTGYSGPQVSITMLTHLSPHSPRVRFVAAAAGRRALR